MNIQRRIYGQYRWYPRLVCVCARSIYALWICAHRINMRRFTQNFNWYRRRRRSRRRQNVATHIYYARYRCCSSSYGYACVRTSKIVGIGIWLGELLNVNCRLQSHTRHTHTHSHAEDITMMFWLWDLFITWHLLHGSSQHREKRANTAINWAYRKCLIRVFEILF